MRKTSITILIASAFPFLLNAQESLAEVVASSGNCFEQSSVSLEWTLGETVVETYSNGTETLTQGFQQPVITVSTVFEDPDFQTGINVYPVPFIGTLSVELSEYIEDLHLEIHDVHGKKILEQIIRSNLSTLDLHEQPAGEYFLTVKNDQGMVIKSMAMIKH